MRAEKERPKREFSDDFFSLFRTKIFPRAADLRKDFLFHGFAGSPLHLIPDDFITAAGKWQDSLSIAVCYVLSLA